MDVLQLIERSIEAGALNSIDTDAIECRRFDG